MVKTTTDVLNYITGKTVLRSYMPVDDNNFNPPCGNLWRNNGYQAEFRGGSVDGFTCWRIVVFDDRHVEFWGTGGATVPDDVFVDAMAKLDPYLSPYSPGAACTIQGIYFVRNHSVEWGSCEVSPTDSIEIEMDVTFGADDVGKTYEVHFTYTPPDGGNYLYTFPDYAVTSSGTFSFITPAFTPAAGTYKINSANAIIKGTTDGCLVNL